MFRQAESCQLIVDDIDVPGKADHTTPVENGIILIGKRVVREIDYAV